jgi:hypothetical protein
MGDKLRLANQLERPDGVAIHSIRDAELASTDDNHGWNRASIIFRSRHVYRPDIRRDDLLLPSGTLTLKTLVISFFCGVAITLLYIWVTFFFVRVLAGVDPGIWFAAIMAGAPLALGGIIFVLATRETKRDREYARTL